MLGLYLSALSKAISASAIRPWAVSTLPKFPYAVDKNKALTVLNQKLLLLKLQL